MSIHLCKGFSASILSLFTICSVAVLNTSPAARADGVTTTTDDFPVQNDPYVSGPINVTFGNTGFTLTQFTLDAPAAQTHQIHIPIDGTTVFEDKWPEDGDLDFTYNGAIGTDNFSDPNLNTEASQSLPTKGRTNFDSVELNGLDFFVPDGEQPTESIEIRQSATPSTGMFDVTDNGNGTFQITSFFDIFTEISLDGGQTWTPADESFRVNLVAPLPQSLAAGSVLLLGLGLIKQKWRPAVAV